MLAGPFYAFPPFFSLQDSTTKSVRAPFFLIMTNATETDLAIVLNVRRSTITWRTATKLEIGEIFFLNSPIKISLLWRKETKLAIFSKIFAKIYPARETETGLAIIVFQNIANPASSSFKQMFWNSWFHQYWSIR